MKPKQRHVMVSGGTRGLGTAIVRRLLGQQWSVSTFGRKSVSFVETCRDEHPESFHFSTADMQDRGSLRNVVRDAEGWLGPIYGLVNNAGIASDGLLATSRAAEIDRVITTNLTGTLQLTQFAVRRMLLQRAGSIINISSIIGIRGYSGLAAYGATKAGIDGMTRALAREVGPAGIRVNSVAPGYLRTEMTHGLTENQLRQIANRTPLGRLGTAEDVTGLVEFLLSDDSRFITGQVIAVEGGITC